MKKSRSRKQEKGRGDRPKDEAGRNRTGQRQQGGTTRQERMNWRERKGWWGGKKHMFLLKVLFCFKYNPLHHLCC
jgi:hypothetical protein